MSTKDFVNINYPTLLINSLHEEAINLFKQKNTETLVLISDKNVFMGLLHRNEIISNPHETLLYDNISTIHADIDCHPYEVFELMLSNATKLIPIVKENEFYGVITFDSLFQYIETITGFNQKGAVLIITVPTNNYTLHHICQIIENNGAKVLHLYIEDQNDEMTEITIKVNTFDISSIQESFNRYEYSTKTLFAQNEIHEDFIKNRIDNLLSYLSI